MKRTAVLFAVILVGKLTAQEPLTYEVEDSLFSNGDFNEDGRIDVVVVDKESGGFAVGFGRPDGGVDWSPLHPSGFEHPSGLAVGRFEGTLGIFGITAPNENRATAFALPDPALAAPLSQHIFPDGPAPRSIAGFFVNADDSSDFVMVGDRGNIGSRYYTQALSFGEGDSVSLNFSTSGTETRRIWRMVPEIGADPLAVLCRGPEVVMASVGAGGLSDLDAVTGLVASEDARFAYGFFGTGQSHRAIFFESGETTATSVGATNNFGSYEWGTSQTLTFPKPLALLVAISAAGGDRLAALYTDDTAMIFDYDGATLSHRSDLPGSYGLLAPTGTDSLVSLAGVSWSRWDTSSSAATLTPTAAGVSFPAPGTAGNVVSTSNVIFASGEPFVDEAAEPLFFGHVRDWTTAATRELEDWTVTSLSQTGAGLALPVSVPYEPDGETQGALVNQLKPNASFRLLENVAYGKNVGDVFINPPAGTYEPPTELQDRLSILLTTDLENAVIYYHILPVPFWLEYDPANPPRLGINDPTIEFYAENTETRTPTRSASYIFADPSALAVGDLIDLDKDGLPDQWEDAFNAYNPLDDTDGDGSNNLEEYQNCTDPHDPASNMLPPLELFASGDGSDLVLEWSTLLPTAVLQKSSDLATWIDITTGITADGETFRYETSLLLETHQFFRLKRP